MYTLADVSHFVFAIAIPYTIRIATGDKDDEGTEANVHIVLIGTDNVSEKIPLELIGKDEFAAKSVETFSVEALDVGEIKKVEVRNYFNQIGNHPFPVVFHVP